MIPNHLNSLITTSFCPSSPAVYFFVPGKAAPGGSKTAFGFKRANGSIGARIIDAGKNNKQWRAVVSLEAKGAMTAPPLTGPVVARAVFVVARPKSHLNSKGQVKPSAPPFPTTKPDATKLWRAVEDAMTGIVWIDDAQVIHQSVSKVYGDTPGVHVAAYQCNVG